MGAVIAEGKRKMSRKLKAKAWKLFSTYIRRKYADRDGMVSCVTCGVRKHWKDGIQAGHFIDSRNNSILFQEDLTFPQCCSCNMFKKGNKVKYTLFMLKKYTKKQVEEMSNLKFKTKKITDDDYLELIDDLQDKLIGLDIRDGKL